MDINEVGQIDHLNTKASQGSGTSANERVTRGQEGQVTEQQGQQEDNIELTDRAQFMQKIEQQLKNSPDIDHAKVAQLKQLIADGGYTIDAEKLAAKMIELEKM